MSSWQTVVVKAIMRRLKNRVSSVMDDIPKLRKEKDQFLSKLWSPRGIEYRPFLIDEMQAEWFIPTPLTHKEKILYYLHGGGYAIGSINAYRSLISKLARSLEMRVMAINYRLAPENPFPAALDDAMMGYRWLVEDQGFDPEDIIIAGDSAGGGLVVSTLLSIRDSGEKGPAAAVLLSPWVDLAGSGKSVKEKAEVDPILPAAKLKEFGLQYAGKYGVKHPLVSPLYADLKDLPPLLIQVGTDEIVMDDSIRLHKKAKDAGVKVELEVWDNMPHVWHISWHILPEARQAIDQIAQFVFKQFDLTPTTETANA